MVNGIIDAIQYYFPGLAGWTILNPASPPQVPVGTEFHLKIWWQNSGDITCRGTVNIEVTKPDGTKVNLNSYLGQNTELASGYSTYVQFHDFVVNQVGTYSAKIDLYGEEIAVAVGIEVHIANYPANSYMWNPVIYVPTKANPQFAIYPPRYLYMSEFLVHSYTVGGINVPAEIDIIVVDSASNWIYSKLAQPVIISDGKRYCWNCSNHSLEEYLP